MTTSNYLEEAFLKVFRGGGAGTTLTAPAAVFVKLHTGDPGEDCTANAATNTTRTAVTFAAPSNPAGTMASSADVTWTTVSTTENYLFFSLWDLVAAGNPLGSGALTGSTSVTAGDTFTITSGTLIWTVT